MAPPSESSCSALHCAAPRRSACACARARARASLYACADRASTTARALPRHCRYIAPEIVKGTGHGKAADYYALGCFLYECLSGWTPYVRDDEYGLSIYRYVVKKPVEAPEGMALDSPAWNLLSAMLEKDPAKRIGTLEAGVQGIVQHLYLAGLVDGAAIGTQSFPAPWTPPPPRDPLDFDHLKPDDEYEEETAEYEDDGSGVFDGF